MAMSASMRLPWRIIGRQTTINPIISSTSLLRAAQPSGDHVNPTFSRRYESSSARPPSTSAATAAKTAPTQDYPPPPSHPDPENKVDVRLPRSVQAVYLKPLRRIPRYGIPSCDLQLRSYSVRNLEFFADFAMRAAYYLNLPASGPVPLPRIVERWTVPKGSFIHKKSQENFERKTLRRLIQIKDGHPETVEIWLAFLKKHAYYGIGMKANVWNYEKLGVGKTMDATAAELKDDLESKMALLGLRKQDSTAEKITELISREDFKASRDGPMTKTHPTPLKDPTFN